MPAERAVTLGRQRIALTCTAAATTAVCALETHQEKSSEVIIPVLEHAKLHVGTGRDSVREIMIKHPN